MELKTTRAADGAITTSTPGAPSGGFDPSALFQQLIAYRLQNPNRAVAPTAPKATGARMMAQPQASVRSPAYGGQYEPQLGQAPIQPSVGVQDQGNNYSYRFGSANGGSWAGSAPQLPTWTGKRNPNDYIGG